MAGQKNSTAAAPENTGAEAVTVEQLQEQLDQAIAAHAAEVEAHNATKQALENAQNEVAIAAETVKALEAKVGEAKAEVASNKKVITVKNKKYEVAPGNYSFEDTVVNGDVLAIDEKLAEKLIKMGAGFIKPLED